MTYGVLHDQVTARVCIEYFTVAHPEIVPTTDPTILGLVWGVIATWWVGAGLGVLLVGAARLGSWPPRHWRELVRPIGALMLAAGLLAATGGLVSWIFAATPGSLFVPANGWPAKRQVRFMAVAVAHNLSYLAGCVGGFVLSGLVLLARKRSAGAPVAH
ncbi:MAG: hypothetical protein AAF907_02355 [Planctomycetota bacterium]